MHQSDFVVVHRFVVRGIVVTERIVVLEMGIELSIVVVEPYRQDISVVELDVRHKDVVSIVGKYP